MPNLPIDGVDYQVTTQGRGDPILLLHGFTGASTNWTQISQALVNRYQVIAPDLLGHGQTSSPAEPSRYQIERAAADLVALIDQLGLDTVNLLGYSMGGRLALYIACHYPQRVKTLILESASPGLATDAEREARRVSDQALAERIERDGLESFVRYWEALPLFASRRHLPASIREALHVQRLRNHPQGLANSLRGMGTGVQPSLWENLSLLTVPTWMLCGAADAKFTAIAQQMVDQMPTARLNIVPGVGHAVHLEAPEAVVAILLERC